MFEFLHASDNSLPDTTDNQHNSADLSRGNWMLIIQKFYQ